MIRPPRREWRGLTGVGWLNVLVLQWAFVRLSYTVDVDPFGWRLLRWVVPCTGWHSRYRYVGRHPRRKMQRK